MNIAKELRYLKAIPRQPESSQESFCHSRSIIKRGSSIQGPELNIWLLLRLYVKADKSVSFTEYANETTVFGNAS